MQQITQKNYSAVPTASRQRTVAHPVQCSGVGLHSGKMVTMTLRPAPVDSGIRFYVQPGSVGQAVSEVSAAGCVQKDTASIIPSPHKVIATGLATTLGQDGVNVSTVEHLLAAVRGLGVDNLRIDVAGGELPIMDGSAAPFVLLFKNAGLKVQNAPRRVWRIKTPFTHKSGEKFIKAMPYNGFKVDYTIVFAHPTIGEQRLCLEITPETFAGLARARTFGFSRDVEMLYASGLALGGSLDNSVVLDEHGVINQEGLRFPDEFVRHKILDFVGDMAMLDLPLQGHFVVHCSGHSLNNQFLRILAENSDLYLEKVTERLDPSAQEPAVAGVGGKLPGTALPSRMAGKRDPLPAL